MTDMTYLVFGVVLGMWPNICIRSLRSSYCTSRLLRIPAHCRVEPFSSNANVLQRIHQISLIYDKSVTTQNLAFLSYLV